MNNSQTKKTDTFFSESALSGIPWMVISKLLLFFVYFLISVTTVRFLGSESYGIYVICKSIAEVCILICTLGMTATFMRFIPELILSKNKAGISRLILKASFLQAIAVLISVVCLMNFSHLIEGYFSIQVNSVIFFTCLLIIFELIKTNINAILTALYKVKTLAIFSTIHGICWLLLLVSLLNNDASVSNALIAPSISYALIYAIAGLTIYRYLKSLNWKSPSMSIGKKRVLQHSGSIAVSTIIRLLMLKYTELFFLASEHDATVVGAYDLAYSIPLMVILFIPAAVQDLFVAGFSEAYVKDQTCLPHLIRSFYKLIIILTVPLAVFGFYFAPDFFVFAYGEETLETGKLAALFCLLHLLPLISTPLSMAIQAKEKVFNMFPTMLLQLSVNIALDYLFIVELKMGLMGAISAVFLTFALTIPIRLYVVKLIIGGIYFPVKFFLKVFSICLLIGGLLEASTHSPSVLLLFAFVPIYFILLIGTLSSGCVFSREDLADFTNLISGKPKKLLVKLKNMTHVNILFTKSSSIKQEN
jgi:O-antigen/teichoic acid export membrane protein